MNQNRMEGPRGGIQLRPVELDDVGWMATMAADRELVGPHNWAGQPRDPAQVERELRERLELDGALDPARGTLVVELEDGTPIGDVSWRTERWGPSAGSACLAFGIALLPQFRGRGYGTSAQRLLVDRLFELNQSLHRVQSDTAHDNPAEQRSLTKIGLKEEGRVREAEYRDGVYHDHLVYGILRPEWEVLRRAEAAAD